MHGRKKVSQSEAELNLQREKADTYRSLVEMIMDRKTTNSLTSETLILTEKLLKNNPDFYSLWNFRRNILLKMHGESLGLIKEQQINKIPSHLGEKISTIESNFTTEPLRRNPKSCKIFLESVMYVHLHS